MAKLKTNLGLSCDCGAVKGVVKGVSKTSGNRLICCCEDCQAFVQALGRAEDVLDVHGGTDIFQTAPATIEITQGLDQIRCLRLTEKGTNRWYAGCCKTPIGNTLGPNLPFVGLVHRFLDQKDEWDRVVGPPRARVQTRHARNLPEDAPTQVGFPWQVTFKIMLKILGWKLSGKGRPHPFFDSAGKAISEPVVTETV